MTSLQGIVFDLDGTAVPNGAEGLPSQKLIKAVKKAKQKVFVSVATGRTFDICQNIFKTLDIESLCIISGGSQIVDPKNGKVIWKQPMTKAMVQETIGVLNSFNLSIAIEDIYTTHPFTPESLNSETFSVGVYALEPEVADDLKRNLHDVSGIAAHLFPSWTKGKYGVHITHELATKKHAFQALLAHLNVDHEKVMVIGDGENDLPLFELAGLKIAMGNGAPKLKAAADWIAPSVDNDGLAAAIEKFLI